MVEVLATAGGSASVASANTFLRVFRAWVSKSGSYAVTSNSSHLASVIIENSAGTEDWATIVSDAYGRGQTEISAYSVPLGFTAFMPYVNIHVAAAQPAGILLFKRENILETTPPYSAARVPVEIGGAINGEHHMEPTIPIGPFNELTDIIFMAKSGASTADVSINFELILVRNDS